MFLKMSSMCKESLNINLSPVVFTYLSDIWAAMNFSWVLSGVGMFDQWH